MPAANRRQALVTAIRNRSPEMHAKLRALKAEAATLRQRPDLLWYLLLQSFSTWGNAGGWQRLFADPALFNTITEASLLALPQNGREARIFATIQAAGLRWPERKSSLLAENFQRIVQMGGVALATQHMLSLPSRASKFAFVKQFEGIGEKYGRNIWMDIYDESFRQDIAVDDRIKGIAEAIGIPNRPYGPVEAFFQQVAHDSNLEPWEVDRLLFNFKAHFLAVITNAA